MNRGNCKGGPLDGRSLAHTLDIKPFGERLNPPPSHKHVVAGEPEPAPEKPVFTITGHYRWDRRERAWIWEPNP